jgi:putative peptidoglycan lipid II flippase
VSRQLKNISVVAAATVASRILGLMRDQLGAAVFGANVMNDAFITAFSLPNLFRRLLGEGSLTAAFVPTLQREIRDHGQVGAFRLLNQVVSWLALVTGALVVVAMAVFSQSRRLAGHEDKWYLAADLSVILFPYLAMICVAAALSATLNVFQRFLEPAVSPILLNLCMIVSLGGAGWHWADTDLGRVHWLCAGVLAGGVLQVALPAVVLVRLGWRPRLELGLSPRVREIALLMAPGLLGTAIYQVNVYISRLFAFSVDESAATLLFYANRLMELPIGVFAIAVTTVVYPLIARHAAEGRVADLAADYRKGLRLILIINIPAAAGLVLLSEPIVRLLFQHGRFTAGHTAAMAPLLMLFAVGLPFFSIVSLTIRAFYALDDTRTPVLGAAASFVVNIGLAWGLKDRLGAPGLVLASTAAIIVQTVLLQQWLERRLPELRFGTLWPGVLKVLAATAAMGLLVWAGWRGLSVVGLGGVWRDLVAVGGLIPVAVAVYALLLWMLKIEGREEFAAMFARLRTPRVPPS